MEATPADAELAEKARVILAKRGRAELSVNAVQIAKWRAEADALPVVSDRGPGRGRSTVYAADAAEVAASLASALADDRNLDRAILAALAMDAPVAEKGLQSAAGHYLLDLRSKAKSGYADRYISRTPMRRALLSAFPSRAHGDAGVLMDAFLSLFLGRQPDVGDAACRLIFDVLLSSVESTIPVKDSRALHRAGFLISRWSVKDLQMLVRSIDIDDWRESCKQMDVIFKHTQLFADLVRRCGLPIEKAPEPVPLLDALYMFLERLPAVKRSPHLYLSLFGLVAAGFSHNLKYARALESYATACTSQLPGLKVLSSLASDIPVQWLPGLGPVEGAWTRFMDCLADNEKKEFFAWVHAWRDAHLQELRKFIDLTSSADPDSASLSP